MGSVLIREVVTKADLKKFIYLPSVIHKGDSNWLPPIYMDERELFDRDRNNSFEYADTIMLLAEISGKAVGRIMGIISHRYNEYRDEQNGRFCFIEAINDKNVVKTLIDSVAKWAKERGMKMLVGPLGFSDKDPQGLQVEGFEHHSIITTPTNYPYLQHIIEDMGFEKKVDLVNYLVDIPSVTPPFFENILPRIQKNGKLELLEFNKTRELKPFIIEVLQLMNDTFTEVYGFVPLTDREKTELAKRYLPILNPSFIKLVRSNGKLIAFAIGMPDISEGIKKAKGRLFPFGIFKILRSARKTDNLIMLLGGILKDYRGQGIDVLMGAKMINSAMTKRIKTIDSHLVLETNSRMRAEYERMGGRIIRRFRIYEKDLSE